MKISVAIVFDMNKKKPYGLWVTDKEIFGQYYLEEYTEEGLYFINTIGNIELEEIEDWDEFWSYWLSQGGHNTAILGPYQINIKGNIPIFGKETIKNLDKFIKENKEVFNASSYAMS